MVFSYTILLIHHKMLPTVNNGNSVVCYSVANEFGGYKKSLQNITQILTTHEGNGENYIHCDDLRLA